MLSNLIQMKKLLFVLLLSISPFTFANWSIISSDEEIKLYVNTTTIQQVNQYQRIWTKVEYDINSPMNLERKIRSSRSYEEFDCREIKVRTLKVEFFKQPNLIDSSSTYNKVDEWNFIAPSTHLERIFRIVCKNK
jgi:DUF4097 and DUF4098 domain-containing protein YvlB